MKIKCKYFPKDIIKHYNLHLLMTNDNYIYIRIKKGMYGFKQVTLLANDILQQ